MNKHRNIHVLFSLSLFLLFVIGSFFIVTYEIKGYQVINDTCQQEDDLIVPLAYLNTKLKANDSDDSTKIVEIDNTQCLEIKLLRRLLIFIVKMVISRNYIQVMTIMRGYKRVVSYLH